MSEPNPNTQRYLDILHSALDIAHDILKDIHQQAAAQPEPPAHKPDYTIPTDRILRAIRRTVLLAVRLAEPPKPGHSDAAPKRTAARKRIIREVEDYICRNTDDADATAAYQADLLDRLDSQELDDEIDTRPVPDIIIDIVRDLGLDTDWGPNRFKQRTQADIAALAARAAELCPSEPKPPRPAPPRPKRKRLHLDETLSPAETVAAILKMGRPPGR